MHSQAQLECFGLFLLPTHWPRPSLYSLWSFKTWEEMETLLHLFQKSVSELDLRFSAYTQALWQGHPIHQLDSPHLGHEAHTQRSVNRVCSLMRPEPRHNGHNWYRHFNVLGWFLILSLALVYQRTHSNILYLKLAVISNQVEFFPTFETTK